MELGTGPSGCEQHPGGYQKNIENSPKFGIQMDDFPKVSMDGSIIFGYDILEGSSQWM